MSECMKSAESSAQHACLYYFLGDALLRTRQGSPNTGNWFGKLGDSIFADSSEI